MDSEHGINMHDPIEIDDDVESLDSDGDSKLIDNDEDDNAEDDDSADDQQNYTILNEEDVFRLQDEDITTMSTVLTISKVSASILLQHYNWIASKVHDAWFADEEKVRGEVGLLKRPVLEIPHTVKKLDCGICFETYHRRKLNAAACGHPFCGSCWTSYISTSIADGPGCLTLRCPEPSCRAAVGQDMINMLASDEDKHKYSRYLLRSYIENNKKIKWCPAPGCDYAVDFVGSSDTNNYDVSCHCKYGFCWNCTEEIHRPVDCNTVAKWIFKNSDESQNTNWILANSKPCPKCKRPIEKNQGCMHMACISPCNFHFCWLCLADWNKHGYDMQACNRFKKSNQEGANDETDQRRKMAKESIQKYTHYYERWAANHSSREKAVADLKQMQSVHIQKLGDKQCQIMAQLGFVTEAWIQIVECRCVLKWTYAYGYYIPEHEKQLFEYLQGEAELGLERLHDCAENELQKYLNSDGPSEDFNEFRKKLDGLTKATRKYFENLVRSLENGLLDVKSEQGACSQSGSSKNLVGTKGRDGRGKGTFSISNGPPRVEEPVVSQVEEDLNWVCEHCTYVNYNNTTPDCQICNLPRHFER